MIYGYKGNDLVWRIWRNQRKPGRFTKEYVPTGRQNIFYVTVCQTATGMSLLKGFRQLAKEHGIRLSTKEEIICLGCNTPLAIDSEEKYLGTSVYSVYCRNCRIYCSYHLDVTTPKRFLREIFSAKLKAYFEQKKTNTLLRKEN